MSPTLFSECDSTAQWPSWFTPGTTTPACHKAHVQRGRHPLGLPLLRAKGEGPERFGNCGHRCTQSMSRTYHKCGLFPVTNGPATDLRLGWPACMSYKREDAR